MVARPSATHSHIHPDDPVMTPAAPIEPKGHSLCPHESIPTPKRVFPVRHGCRPRFAEDLAQVHLEGIERGDAHPRGLGDGGDDALVLAIEPVRDQGRALRPDQPVKGHKVALQEQGQGQGVQSG